MIDLGSDFDFDVENMTFENRAFDPVPPGTYIAEMTKIENRDTKSGGQMLSATFRIIDGAFENRLVFANYNHKNQNPKAVQIATEDLGKIAKAVGERNARYPDNFLFKPLAIKVKVEPDNRGEGYPPRNAIVDYSTASEASPAPAPMKAAPAGNNRPASSPQAGSVSGSRPWARPSA